MGRENPARKNGSTSIDIDTMILESTHIADRTGRKCVKCGVEFGHSFDYRHSGIMVGQIKATVSGAVSFWHIPEIKPTTPELCAP